MLLGLVGALLPVLLGVGVALLPRVGAGVVGPTRTFALAAALVVVLLEMLPAAASELGPLALVAFVASVLAPGLLEFGVSRISKLSPGILTLELGYLGLLLHQAVDGFGIGVAGQQAAVTLSIAAHSAPLVAASTLGYSARLGPRAALWRGVGLLLLTAVGVVAGSGATQGAPDGIDPWLQAILGGFLLHVLGHGLETDPPRTAGARLTELAAMAAGLLLPLGWMDLTFAGTTPDSRLSVLDAAAELGVETAPALLVGLLVGLPLRQRLRRLEAGSFGTLVGALLRPEVVMFSVVLLGGQVFLWMMGLAVLLAGVSASLGGRWPEVENPWHDHPPHPEQEHGWRRGLERSLVEQGPLWVVGLGLAAYAEAFLPPGSLSFPGALGAVAGVALLSQLAPLAALPLATVLGGKGLPMEGVIAVPLLASLYRFSFFQASWKHRGWRGPGVLLGSLGAAVALVLLVGRWLPTGTGLRLDHLPLLEHPLAEMAAAVVLGLMLVGSIGWVGPRHWFATLARKHSH